MRKKQSKYLYLYLYAYLHSNCYVAYVSYILLNINFLLVVYIQELTSIIQKKFAKMTKRRFRQNNLLRDN